jgi:signal transduction histidine kinase/ActR/RegA family two-component response regulator
VLVLPVIAYDRVVALAELAESRRRHEFGEREIALAQALANQAAVAVENAHLLQDRERRITELGILNQIGRTFSSDLELGALLETMYEQVGRLFGTTSFLVALYEEGSDEWNMALHVQRGQRFVPSQHKVDSGLTGYILRSRRPVLLRNLEENLAFHGEHGIPFTGERASTWMGVPLIAADRVVGAMAIQDYEQENRFGNQDLVVLSTIAAQAAIAIVNARLYSQVRQQLKNLREAYDEVQRAQDQLIQAQKMEAVGLLAAGVAHDFNNLLTIISLYTDQALQQLVPSSPLYPDLEEVRQAVLRATGLIRQLLLFSRQQPIEPRTLNLGVLVAGLLKILRRLLREEVTISLDLPQDLWTVQADPGAMEQIVINLVMNARDAIPREGSIKIRASNVQIDGPACHGHTLAEPGPHVCLLVEDSGVGMDQETLDRIFEPFFTTKALGKGTGLGLAVVQQIVERHRGWIDVQSTPNRGTCFAIYLPSSPEIAEDAETPTDAPPARGHGERILLVEDSPPLRAVLQDALSEAGYTVLAAENSEQALTLFVEAGGGVDLILSDVMLPGDRGYLLADELTSGQPDLPVLLISGYLEDQDEWERIRERGYPFLPKPFTIAQLLHQVHDTLRESESGEEGGTA